MKVGLVNEKGVKMFSYSKQQKVGGNTYTIELIDVYVVNRESDVGLCNFDKLEISVACKSENGSPKALTVIERLLWHELLHAIARTWNVDLNNEDTERLAQGLTQVLGDNGFTLVKRVE